MGGNSFTEAKVDAGKMSDQQPGRKGFDWMNLIKIPNEEKDHWVSVCCFTYYPFLWLILIQTCDIS
jgi:hypothetical protein